MQLPPELILFQSFNGDWDAYENELYHIFLTDLVCAEVEFQGLRVNYRRYPESSGRMAAFWHLIQEGRIEENRRPDLRRCERLRWIRWMIDNSSEHSEIDEWQNTRGTESNTLLWYQESYLVVLAKRGNSWLLKTAYCTDYNSTIKKLRRERDRFRLNS